MNIGTHHISRSSQAQSASDPLASQMKNSTPVAAIKAVIFDMVSLETR